MAAYVGESKGWICPEAIPVVYEYIIIDVYTYCTVYLSVRMFPRRNGTMSVKTNQVHSPVAAFGWIQGILPSSTKSPGQRDNGARVLQSHQLAIIITRHPIHLSRTQSHRIANGDEHMACLRKTSTSLGGSVIYCNPGDFKQFRNREIYQTYLWLDDFWVHASVLSSNIQQDPSTPGNLLSILADSGGSSIVSHSSQSGQWGRRVTANYWCPGEKKGKRFYSPNKNGNSNIRVHF